MNNAQITNEQRVNTSNLQPSKVIISEGISHNLYIQNNIAAIVLIDLECDKLYSRTDYSDVNKANKKFEQLEWLLSTIA